MRRKGLVPAAASALILPLVCTAKQNTAGSDFLTTVRLPVEVSVQHDRHWRDPYVAQWSNRRGDRLIITASTVKFGGGKRAPYRDLTRVTNGREFQLEVTSQANLDYLTTFLLISFGEGDKIDQMKVTLYNSRKDMESGENSQGEAIWYRDK